MSHQHGSQIMKSRILLLTGLFITVALVAFISSSCSLSPKDEEKDSPCGELTSWEKTWIPSEYGACKILAYDTSATATFEPADLDIRICKEEHISVQYEMSISDTFALKELRYKAKVYWGLSSSIVSFAPQKGGGALRLYAEDNGIGLKQQAPADSAGWIGAQVIMEFKDRGNFSDNVAYLRKHVDYVKIKVWYNKFKKKELV